VRPGGDLRAIGEEDKGGGYQVELPGEERGAAVLGLRGVGGVVLEELALIIQGLLDALGGVDVLLATVDDGDVAEAEGDDTAGKNVQDVGALVHNVNLGEDSDGPDTLRVDLPGEVEAVRVGKIGVGGRHSQNNRVLLGDELDAHVPDLLLNVLGLALDGDLGHARKIDQGEVKHAGRVNLEIDRDGGHALVAIGDLVRVLDDLLPDLVKVGEDLTRPVQELAPLVGFLALLVLWGIDQLKNLQEKKRKEG